MSSTQPSGFSGSHAIATVLLCAALLLCGNGLLQTLLPLRADLEGFTTASIGLLGTAYFGGFALGCFVGPVFIKSVGHVRAFAGAAAIFTALSLIFPLFVNAYVWGGLRVLSGACVAMLFIVVESWLNDRSTNENRGRILSLYIIVTNIVTMMGQMMVNLGNTAENVLFMLTAMLLCLSIVPLSLTPTVTPKPIPSANLNLRYLFQISPAAAMGCMFIGCAEGAFWSLGPVFGQERGMSVFDVTMLMAAFVLGGTLSQWPLGWASDKMDRRIVIAFAAFGGVITGLMLAFVTPQDARVTFLIAVAHGALMVPLYALCVSHANDKAPNEKMVEVSSGLLLTFSVGAALGPLLAPYFMRDGAPGGLFIFIAAMLGGLGLVVILRRASTPLPDDYERSDFYPVPKTSQSVYALESEN